MKERPIIFSGESVRAIIAGTKTMTRRIMKPQPVDGEWQVHSGFRVPIESADDYGPWEVGMRLWVKEAWRTHEHEDTGMDGILFPDDDFMPIYNSEDLAERWSKAHDNGKYGDKWRSPLFMPRWASRLTLEVVGVRVERVQDISEMDCYAEGRPIEHETDPVSMPGAAWYADLFDVVNGKGSWASNPWVWVIEFKTVTTGNTTEGGAK